MTLIEFVADRVRDAYWNEDIHCVPTVLRILGELFGLDVHEQVYASCWGLNGAGNYGAQCGLVEGTLMFISLIAGREGIDTVETWQACSDFASDYEKRFGSLRCCELRPEGFNDDDPPHLCEVLTVESVVFSARFINTWFGIEMELPGLKSTRRSYR
ncbi:MAG: C_GCAxxG_C_C family protein [Candidatus Hydrogenedentota bacterium]|nr:MAG: C_GCAxxG_C_C family protein [Candidatus Hydrogenedentota bacterium]